MISTGCTILRDARGNPGEMILHRREATQEEVDALCRKLMDVAGMLDRMAKKSCSETENLRNGK